MSLYVHNLLNWDVQFGPFGISLIEDDYPSYGLVLMLSYELRNMWFWHRR